MNPEILVREIVLTYDLPARMQERAIRTATRRVSEMHLNGFDSIYRYVANLVDNMMVPYRERIWPSLDQLIKHGSGQTFHDIIGAEDPLLAVLSARHQAEEQYIERPSFSSAFEMLRDQLSETEADFIHRLLSRTSENVLGLNVATHRLRDGVEQFRQRLESLVSRYHINGRIIIPPRPIHSVDMVNFVIRYGQRRYDSRGPIAYFDEHRDTYDGLNRRQLHFLDQGLAASLYRWGQMDSAIPEKVPPQRNIVLAQDKIKLPPQKVITIVTSHGMYKSANEVARNIGVGTGTVTKYWRVAGLPVNSTNDLSDEQIGRIVSAYSTYNGSSYKASKALGHSTATILRHWRDVGLEIKKPGQHQSPIKDNSSLPETEVAKILEAYKTYHRNALEASRHIGHERHTIGRHWARAGYEVRKGPKSKSARKVA